MATQAQQSQLLAFLVGAFDAAPTVEIFAELTAAIDAGVSVDGLSDIIVGSDVFKGLYADDAAFVANFPTALVGDFVSAEVLADAEGVVAQWINEDGMSIAAVISNALIALAGVDSADETWGAAKVALENKVTVAQYYVDNVSGATLDLATLQGVLAGVTQDAATVTTAQASIDATANAGETFTLTTATDDDFIGTANNDTFVASTSTDDAGDSIIDISTTDNDTMNWSLTTDPAAIGTIKNVENINFTTATATDLTFDMSNVTGAKAVSVVREDYLDGKLDGTGTFDIDAAKGAASYTFGAQVDDAEVNFNAEGSLAATVTTGTDLKTLLVDNVGEEGVTIVAGRSGAQITVDGLADTDDDGNANDAVTVSAFGEATLTLTSGGDTVENVTLSGNGAALDLDLTGNAEKITLTGDQNITVTASAAELTGEVLVNEATGTTTIVADTAGALDLKKFAVVDEVRLDADFGHATNAVTVNSGQLVSTSKNQNGTAQLTIAAAVTTADAVKTNDVTFAVLDNESTAGITFDDLVFTSFATVNVDGSAEDITGVDLTATGAAVTITGGNDVKFTGSTSAKSIDASAAADVTLTLAASDLSLTTGAGADNITTGAGGVITANLGEGKNILDINAVAAGSSFIMGSGADTVTLDGANSLSVLLGAGDDKVTMSVAADAIIDGGEGTDTVVIDAGGSTDLDVSSKTNFAITGVEKLDLVDSLEVSVEQFANISSVELGGTAAKVLTVDGSSLTSSTAIDASDLVIKVGTTSTTALLGGSKADTITGSDAADVITGGAGGDIMNGGLGADTFMISADDTSVATAGAITSATTGLDIITYAAGDKIDLTGALGTEANYDAFATINTGSVIDLSVTAGTTAGTVSQITGTFDSATGVFTSTKAADMNAIMISYATTDAGTTATQSIVLVGVTAALADTALTDGIITLA